MCMHIYTAGLHLPGVYVCMCMCMCMCVRVCASETDVYAYIHSWSSSTRDLLRLFIGQRTEDYSTSV